jgi:hypothetical protein
MPTSKCVICYQCLFRAGDRQHLAYPLGQELHKPRPTLASGTTYDTRPCPRPIEHPSRLPAHDNPWTRANTNKTVSTRVAILSKGTIRSRLRAHPAQPHDRCPARCSDRIHRRSRHAIDEHDGRNKKEDGHAGHRGRHQVCMRRVFV